MGAGNVWRMMGKERETLDILEILENFKKMNWKL